ncbi:MAG: lipopolysaccharide biosynthesis protein RfbH [Elusimicrobiota bacterium]|jgi:CDP-6-deoxy-D-xylo-4-hexulose-3-dehydrase|nr:lipopolysaccharide biosynthesis protein RfbH [Elusimicrobiota bacterium]
MENLYRKAAKAAARAYFNGQKKKARREYIAASGKVLDEAELNNMIDATLDMWLTTGRFNDRFEKDFAAYLGAKHALSVNSGSSANLLALSALTSHKLGERRVKRGDEVITVAAGFPTTVSPIVQHGMTPVFLDVDINTHNILAAELESALTPKTKAVFVAHTLGNPFNLDGVEAFCKKHNLWLIEDNCDALGAKYNGKFTGTFGHIGTFSFYPAHHITMGEGGAVITNDTNLYRILMSLRDWGRDCWCPPGKDNTCQNRFNMQLGKLPLGYDHKYTYSHLGYNLKITDWQAACALAQLKKLDGFIAKRKENFTRLFMGLKPFDKYFILPSWDSKAEPSWFGFLLTVKEDAGFGKIEFCKYLEQNGIGTRQLFAGNILRQPCFTEDEIPLRIKNSALLNSKDLNEEHYKMLPGTEKVMNGSFWVGVWPGLSAGDIDKTIAAFAKFIDAKAK